MPTPPATFSRLTNRVKAADAPHTDSLLGLAVGVVIIAALSVAREVLIPITLAVLLSFVLGPIVAGLRRLKVPRVISVCLALLGGAGRRRGAGDGDRDAGGAAHQRPAAIRVDDRGQGVVGAELRDRETRDPVQWAAEHAGAGAGAGSGRGQAGGAAAGRDPSAAAGSRSISRASCCSRSSRRWRRWRSCSWWRSSSCCSGRICGTG